MKVGVIEISREGVGLEKAYFIIPEVGKPLPFCHRANFISTCTYLLRSKSEFGTNKIVKKARLWSWLEPFFRRCFYKFFQVVPFSLGSDILQAFDSVFGIYASQKCQAVLRRARI